MKNSKKKILQKKSRIIQEFRVQKDNFRRFYIITNSYNSNVLTYYYTDAERLLKTIASKLGIKLKSIEIDEK
jgi:hypothetical protein